MEIGRICFDWIQSDFDSAAASGHKPGLHYLWLLLPCRLRVDETPEAVLGRGCEKATLNTDGPDEEEPMNSSLTGHPGLTSC